MNKRVFFFTPTKITKDSFISEGEPDSSELSWAAGLCMSVSVHGAYSMIVWSGDGSMAKTAALSSACTLSGPLAAQSLSLYTHIHTRT